MDSRLVLAGKSATEAQLAETLKKNSKLKLPEDAHFTILLHEEIQTSMDTASDLFSIRSYMSFLKTERFGRLLVWSPRLPSTHDIVSQ